MARAMMVGSVNAADAEAVFRLVGRECADAMRWIPDGERGRRVGWIGAQGPVLRAAGNLEEVPIPPGGYGGRGIVGAKFRLRDGVDPAAVVLPFPYADDAADSYRVFTSLQREGALPADVGLQISIPTAAATTLALIDASSQRALFPQVERQLIAQVNQIAQSLPHDDVAIQWDVATEFLTVELVGDKATYSMDELIASLIRLGDSVPDDIALGYHLCYGDAPGGPDGKGHHFVEPTDASLLVDFANRLSSGLGRTLQWIHMPVPIDRDDDAYFAPLAQLQLRPETQLFLGLVHDEDGEQGARRRIAAASKFVRGFGVSTECGLQNEPADAIPRILHIQKAVEVPAT